MQSFITKTREDLFYYDLVQHFLPNQPLCGLSMLVLRQTPTNARDKITDHIKTV